MDFCGSLLVRNTSTFVNIGKKDRNFSVTQKRGGGTEKLSPQINVHEGVDLLETKFMVVSPMFIHDRKTLRLSAILYNN